MTSEPTTLTAGCGPHCGRVHEETRHCDCQECHGRPAGQVVPAHLQAIRQAVTARPGDSLIIRVPDGTPMEVLDQIRQALGATMSQGVKLTVLLSDKPMLLRPDLVEAACKVLHDAHQQAAGPDAAFVGTEWADMPRDLQAPIREGVRAVLTWLVGAV